MELQLACRGLQPPRIRLSSNQACLIGGLKRTCKNSSWRSLESGVSVYASESNSGAKLTLSGRDTTALRASGVDGVEPFRGKSGSVSFYGLTHQLVEEGKLVSAPFKERSGSFLWVLAPIAMISSLVLPQFFLSTSIDAFLKDEILSEIVASFSSEASFYIGLATFLLVTNRVQSPYLQFSPKRWSLITGLKGYIASAFFTMGLKVFVPIFAVYVTWPVLGLAALVAVAPFLAGCLAQFVFETVADKRGSSCWPLVPIIFEVYRLYQLTKAAYFIEKLMFTMKGLPVTPEVMERSGAMVAMLVTFQVLGVICLWSLITFLLRLFPSRPVAEKY
ncbi:uncharacterized protein LOC127794904 [Diospyros lotus]|uniref:uncharacterized protein LOC127794903 n=1 Tax=Diospyros lotus TaxID=55363 RepID=UPI00225501E4|nr:uncharacterized protein LOC127794903 [Diospyros lotus]XP_052182160.1 uncharacterized protein LOC127794904 [Diospyros lotus]